MHIFQQRSDTVRLYVHEFGETARINVKYTFFYPNNSTNLTGMDDIILLITRRDVTLAFNTRFMSFWHSD